MSYQYLFLFIFLYIGNHVMAQDATINVYIKPTTVIQPGTTVTLSAIARTQVSICSIIAYQWTRISAPQLASNNLPIINNYRQQTTTITGMNIPGAYNYVITIQDCVNKSSNMQVMIRVVGGAYDTAHVRVVMDNYGSFIYNGQSIPVRGMLNGDELITDIPNVQPNDIFILNGYNRPNQDTGTNPAWVAATINWRDMNFNTNNMTWRCIDFNMTDRTGSNAWMLPGYNDASWPYATTVGINNIISRWSIYNNNQFFNLAPETQYIWYEDSNNYMSMDGSVTYCRYVFKPPPEITIGVTFISNGETIPTTKAPTTTTPTATTTPTDSIPTTPTDATPTDAPNSTVIPPTTTTPRPSPTPSTGPVIQKNIPQSSTEPTSSSNSISPLFIALPVVAACLLCCVAICYRRRMNEIKINTRLRIAAANL